MSESTLTALTSEEVQAGLSLDQLKQLVGLVEYDATNDPFPVVAQDAVCFVVGNATQTATFYQLALGMELEAYRGPENGFREAKSYVLRSGSARFVFTGGVTPDSPALDHHRRHGDGVVDLALEVPDVDKCIDHARAVGATILEEPHDVSDEHGTVRTVPCSSVTSCGSSRIVAPTDRAWSMHLSTSGTSRARSTTPSPCRRWWSRIGLSGVTPPVKTNRALPDRST